MCQGIPWLPFVNKPLKIRQKRQNLLEVSRQRCHYRVKLRLHTAINQADFVFWWMWFNGLSTKSTMSFSHECILLPSYVYNMHQDTKSAQLIAVCKASFPVIAKTGSHLAASTCISIKRTHSACLLTVSSFNLIRCKYSRYVSCKPVFAMIGKRGLKVPLYYKRAPLVQ